MSLTLEDLQNNPDRAAIDEDGYTLMWGDQEIVAYANGVKND